MKIEKGTIIRTTLLAVSLINLALTSTGNSVLPFPDEQIANTFAEGFVAIASMLTWWKNNSFTKKAIEADKVLKESK
jgi:SPP1 family holin